MSPAKQQALPSHLARTPQRDFRQFEAGVAYWIDYFGLKGWEYDFQHRDLSEDESWAAIRFNISDRWATFSYTTVYPKQDFGAKDPARSAFHEVCELFLGRLTTLADERYAERWAIREAIHEIVRTLENTIFQSARDGKLT